MTETSSKPGGEDLERQFQVLRDDFVKGSESAAEASLKQSFSTASPHVRHQAAARRTTGSDLADLPVLERPLSGNQTALQRQDSCRDVISTMARAADASFRFVRVADGSSPKFAAESTNVRF